MDQKNAIFKNHFRWFYKVNILIIAYFIIMSNSPQNVWGANVYIDPTYSGTQQGTFDKPYNSWSDFTITSGNDYFQKCGTSWTGLIKILNSGTSGNRLLISAYYDDGGVVHESDNPSFGEKCGNNANKPIITDSDQVGSPMIIKAHYIELNSVQVKNGETTIYVNGNYNYIQYCRVMGGIGGIRVGLGSQSNYNYIGYNYIYGYDNNPGKLDLDGIQFAGHTNYSIAEYNVVNGHTHAGLSTYPYASYNEIRYNAVYSYNDRMDQFLDAEGDHNKFHHNYCFDCGVIQIYNADSNEIYYNIIDGLSSNPYFSPGVGAIHISPQTGTNITDNKIYNNLIYDRRDGWKNPSGILMYGQNAAGGVVERNHIINNIFLNFDSIVSPIRVNDPQGLVESDPSDPDHNIYKNNLVYDFTDDYYADMESAQGGSKYSTAALFNKRYGYDGRVNLDSTPGLKNPSVGQFWPDDANDDVVRNGANLDGFGLGPNYNKLLDPAKTDFSKSPPEVFFKNQPPGKWYIGPYAHKLNKPSWKKDDSE